MNSSIAIQIAPKVEGGMPETLKVIDAVINYIASTGLVYEVGAFETTIEGDFDELMEIVKRSSELCIELGAESVSSYVKTVYSPKGKVMTINEKVKKHRA